ncbi:unnamed protein product [Coffea canephora]|uniref:Uncharacterized protein n=1 Tax=Coffea canephora TaxID=49390 RepID=A0A068UTG8_COFCA|nr:unnamed protein product [Coffea canephora]
MMSPILSVYFFFAKLLPDFPKPHWSRFQAPKISYINSSCNLSPQIHSALSFETYIFLCNKLSFLDQYVG